MSFLFGLKSFTIYHFYCVAHTIKVTVLFLVSLLKIQFAWNSSDAFAVTLPQQIPVLVSAHAKNFFSWSSAKNTLQKNKNCLAPKTVIGMSKVANERYLTYLQLCGQVSLWIFMYFGCKTGPKLGENNNNWGLPQNTNKHFFFYKILCKNW